MTGPSREAARVLQMWAMLMQAVAVGRRLQGRKAGRAAYLDEMTRLPTIRRALADPEEPPRPRKKPDYVKECRNDPGIAKQVETAAKLRMKLTKGTPQYKVWIRAKRLIKKLVEEIEYGSGRPSEKSPATILLELINEKMNEIGGTSKKNPFGNPSWLYAKLSERRRGRPPRKARGQRREAQKQRQKEVAAWLHIYSRRWLERRLERYLEMKKNLEGADGHDSDTRQKWTAFLDQMIFVLDSISEFADRRNHIHPYAHHIVAGILRRHNGPAEILAEYEKKYTRLRDQMILWANNADTKILKNILTPGSGESAPVFEPTNREKAVFWGYYGVPCPECKNWRVWGEDDGAASCSNCGNAFRPGFIIHCPRCWTEQGIETEGSAYVIRDGREQPKKAGGSWYYSCRRCRDATKRRDPEESGDEVEIPGYKDRRTGSYDTKDGRKSYFRIGRRRGNCLRTDRDKIIRRSGIRATQGLLHMASKRPEQE